MTIKASCGHSVGIEETQGVFWQDGEDLNFGILCDDCKAKLNAIKADSPVEAKSVLAVTCEVKLQRRKENEVVANRKRDHI
jgi:hypothetical protein